MKTFSKVHFPVFSLRHFFGLFLVLGLGLPSPAFAMRSAAVPESGLEEELAAALDDAGTTGAGMEEGVRRTPAPIGRRQQSVWLAYRALVFSALSGPRNRRARNALEIVRRQPLGRQAEFVRGIQEFWNSHRPDVSIEDDNLEMRLRMQVVAWIFVAGIINPESPGFSPEAQAAAVNFIRQDIFSYTRLYMEGVLELKLPESQSSKEIRSFQRNIQSGKEWSNSETRRDNVPLLPAYVQGAKTGLEEANAAAGLEEPVPIGQRGPSAWSAYRALVAPGPPRDHVTVALKIVRQIPLGQQTEAVERIAQAWTSYHPDALSKDFRMLFQVQMAAWEFAAGIINPENTGFSPEAQRAAVDFIRQDVFDGVRTSMERLKFRLPENSKEIQEFQKRIRDGKEWNNPIARVVETFIPVLPAAEAEVMVRADETDVEAGGADEAMNLADEIVQGRSYGEGVQWILGGEAPADVQTRLLEMHDVLEEALGDTPIFKQTGNVLEFLTRFETDSTEARQNYSKPLQRVISDLLRDLHFHFSGKFGSAGGLEESVPRQASALQAARDLVAGYRASTVDGQGIVLHGLGETMPAIAAALWESGVPVAVVIENETLREITISAMESAKMGVIVAGDLNDAMWRLAEIQLPIPLILTPEETLNIPPQFQEAAQIVQVADAASAIEELKQQGLLPIEIDAQALLNVGLEEAQAAAALRRFYQ